MTTFLLIMLTIYGTLSCVLDIIVLRRCTREKAKLRQLKDTYNIPDEELEVPTWKLPKFIRDRLAKRKDMENGN